MNDFNIIDTHAHFAVLENYNFEINNKGTERSQKFLSDISQLRHIVGYGKIIDMNFLLNNYLECMNLHKINISWIHQLSFQHILGYEVLSNKIIAKAIEKHPDKLRGFASVDIRKGKEALLELEDAILNMGMHGFKLNPNDYGGFMLNDKKLLYPFYEKCQSFGIPVSIHTGIPPGSMFKMHHNFPLLLDEVAVDFPQLTIIVEHMGYPWHDLTYFMVNRHENMFITITAIANILIRKNPKIFLLELSKMISQIGSEKILWGSDWTATPNIAEVLSFIKRASIPILLKKIMGLQQITERDKINILGKNALKILK